MSEGPQFLQDRCPECTKELEGVTESCSHCGAKLDPEQLVAVYKTADSMLLPILRSALDAAEVPYVVQGERALGLFPLGSLATGLTRNLVAATIHVPRNRLEEAQGVLQGVE